jgi:hypothetical protein
MSLEFWDEEWYPFALYGRETTTATVTKRKIVRGNSKPTFLVILGVSPYSLLGKGKMSGNSVFVGDPFQLRVQYTADLTSATSIEVRLQDPTGAYSYVSGTQYQGSVIQCNISSAVNNRAGAWMVQGAANFGDGLVHGDAFPLTVKPLGTAPHNG